MLWYLGYVVLFVEDFDRALAYYTDTVGRPVRLRAEGDAEFAVEGAKFAVLARARVPELMGAAHAGRCTFTT